MNLENDVRTEILEAGYWYQRFEFPYGIIVGSWDTPPKVSRLCKGLDLKGKKCLDVGCLEGAAALWMEQQGGIVSCIDAWGEAEFKFNLVKKHLGLQAFFTHMDIYDLEMPAYFDIVLMMGVYYHLRHPLLGIEKAWEACKDYLLLEGEVMPGDKPIAHFYKDEYQGDNTNFWVPTVQCLEDWCESLDNVESVEIIWPLISGGRAGVVIKKEKA